MSILIPLASIDPNPWQPRTHFDEAALTELAGDIQRNGLLQPAVGRLVTAGGTQHPEHVRGLYTNSEWVRMALGEGARVQLAAGERRLRAYRLLADRGASPTSYVADLFAQPKTFGAMPVQLAPFDDARMATLAWSENAARKDITAAEEARFMARLAASVGDGGLGWTHAQIADDLGLERATVSNKIRLLRLPAEALAALEAGEISEAQARVIVTATDVEADDWATMQTLSHWRRDRAAASVEAVVEMARRGVPAETMRKAVVAVKTEVEDAREAEAKEATRTAKELETTNRQLAKKGLAEVAPEDLPVLQGMSYRDYEKLEYRDIPAGCSKNCECFALARDYGGKVVSICTKPRQFKKLVRAAEKLKKEPSKLAAVAYVERFQSELVDASGGLVWTPGVAQLVADVCRRGMSVADTRDTAAAMVATGAVSEDVGERLGEFASGTWTGREETAATLGVLPQNVVLRFFVEALLRHELRSMVEYKNSKSRAADALLVPAQPAPPMPASPREEGEWERPTRLDLLEGKDPSANLADVELRFEEARAHYRTLREADAPGEFEAARDRLADLGRALALSRAAMPPVSAEPEDASDIASEGAAPGVSVDTSPDAVAPPALTPDDRLEAVLAGDVDLLADMTDWSLAQAEARAFADGAPAHIDEAISHEKVRRAADFDSPVGTPREGIEEATVTDLLNGGLTRLYACSMDTLEAAVRDGERLGVAGLTMRPLRAALTTRRHIEGTGGDGTGGDGAAQLAPEVASADV